MKLILGGGPAGLLAGMVHIDHKIIDMNPMGQLNLPFIPGPRILKRDHLIEQLLDELGINYEIHTIKIRFEDEEGYKTSITDGFKREYSQITRGTTLVESSFLSGGASEIEILSDGTDDFYKKVFEKVHEYVKDQIMPYKVTAIDIKKRILKLENSEGSKLIPFEKVISTLSLKVFLKLAGYPDNLINFETKNKHFIQCKYRASAERESLLDYAYTYAINGNWTRCTNFNDYLVYEMTDKWVEREWNKAEIKPKMFEGHEIITTQFNIPIQIQNSIDIQNIGGIEMLGRFAQWNHKIKANEILHILAQRNAR